MTDRDATEQWASDEGRAYVERNPKSVAELEALREEQYGTRQRTIYDRLLDGVDRDVRVLEVGSSIGLQLRVLRRMGFERLFGVDVQRFALEISRRETPEIHVVEADACHLPFRDRAFDLVFTNGTLITMDPSTIDDVLDEIVRCSDRYVFGQEFYADEYTEAGDRGLYWKTNFKERYLRGRELNLLRADRLRYLETDDEDEAFLLERDDR